MKVGIITFHRGANYGGTLQALALQEAIRELGHDPQIIDYWPTQRRFPRIWRGWNLRGGLSNVRRRLLQIYHGEACLRAFEHFRTKHLRMSRPVHSLGDLRGLARNFDAVITGSDQVWNFRRSPAYFLDFDENFQGRRISYAACCTQEEQPADLIPLVGSYISKFQNLSVRDQFSARAIYNASNRVPAIVCDPTLLMKPDWLISSPLPPISNSLIVYHIGNPMPHLREVVIRIKQITGCEKSEGLVASTFNPHFSSETDIAHFRHSPQEWVEKICTAKFVFTDSYHGVLFALRMRVPFLVFTAESGRAPRMKDLGERFGISNRIISNHNSINALDWEVLKKPVTISKAIQEHIDHSWTFLRNSLSL